MSKLLICNGLCNECEAFEICPQKSAVHKKSDCWECGINPFPLEYRQMLWDRMSPSWLCQIFEVSVTNCLTMIEATAEPEQEQQIPCMIERFIRNLVSRDSEFSEMIQQECCKDLTMKFNGIINRMVKRIVLVFHGQCPAQNCHKCWMVEDCQQRDEQSIR